MISLIVLIGSVIFFVYRKDEKVYEDIKENKITLAIMIEKGTGKYVEYRSRTWPKSGYRYSKAECVDRDRKNIENFIVYDALTYTAYMKSTRTAFCTLYFDKDNSAPVISDGSFYVGESIDQEYTNKVNEEVHIKIEDDDVIEYCLSLDSDSRSCNNNWNTIPELTDGWFTVPAFNLGNTDGTKVVYLYLKDGARNISSKDDSIVLDTTNPTCKLWGESTSWTKNNRTIKWGCEDATSGCKVGEVGNKEYNTTTKTSTIQYEIEDNAKNKITCNLTANVYVDKTTPTLNVTNTSNGSSYSGAWTKYNISSALTFSDSNSGINASSLKWGTDGTTWTAISNTSTTGYNDTWSGERNGTGYYQICDVAGNCASKNFTVKIDKTNPTISVSNKTADGSTYSGNCTTQNVNSTVTYSDSSSGINASTFAWSDDNSTWHTISGASTTTGTDTWSSNRSQTVYYRICDNATNCNTVSFYLDKRNSCGGGGGGGGGSSGGGSTGNACSYSKYFPKDDDSNVKVRATCTGTILELDLPCIISLSHWGKKHYVTCSFATCTYGGVTYATGDSNQISVSSCS